MRSFSHFSFLAFLSMLSRFMTYPGTSQSLLPIQHLPSNPPSLLASASMSGQHFSMWAMGSLIAREPSLYALKPRPQPRHPHLIFGYGILTSLIALSSDGSPSLLSTSLFFFLASPPLSSPSSSFLFPLLDRMNLYTYMTFQHQS